MILHRLVTTISGRKRVQVSPGLFKYDPENGFDLNRRQFVAAWNTTDGNIQLFTYQISDDLTTITQMGVMIWTSPDGTGPIHQRFSIAAGAYKGNTASPAPAVGSSSMKAISEIGNVTTFTALLNSDLTPSDSNFIGQGLAGEDDASLSFSSTLWQVHLSRRADSLPDRRPGHHRLRAARTLNMPSTTTADHHQRPTASQPGLRPDRHRLTLRRDERRAHDQTGHHLLRQEHLTRPTGPSVHQSTSTPARPQLRGVPDIASAKLSLEEDVKVSYDYNQNKENYNLITASAPSPRPSRPTTTISCWAGRKPLISGVTVSTGKQARTRMDNLATFSTKWCCPVRL